MTGMDNCGLELVIRGAVFDAARDPENNIVSKRGTAR